ncbi:uncharacterized protein LOC107047710 [Diachasma alloeum]|uniref:Odorant receptor n=1 Tax=Diachasma alloeum TaxID=454923 RepID=A0A4E0RPB5_9HYME|nr:uncharacterized protein LOC107047710 [Diachasma alloeum]THK33266.1 odorant receptor 68 [Diachasma alloeum]
MGRKITADVGIQWIKFWTWPIFTWPPNSKAPRLTKIIFQIGWWIFFIVSILQLASLLGTVWVKRGNIQQFTEALCLAVGVMQVMVKMISAKCYYRQFQYLIEKIEAFVKNANSHEQEVLTKFMQRITPFYLGFNISAIVAALIYALGPFITRQPFPFVVEYPFRVDKQPIYEIIFLIQTIVCFQCGGTSFYDCQLSILLWYGTIQLDMLAEQMRNVNNARELKHCLSIHQDILRYIDDTIKTVRPVVITTVVGATICIASGGNLIVGTGSILNKAQFVIITLAYSFELLCVAWAAESLATAHQDVGWALYSSLWIRNSKEFNRMVIFVVQRCQTPPVIRIGGILPKLSMSYYASYISATYSFFTTLRAILK